MVMFGAKFGWTFWPFLPRDSTFSCAVPSSCREIVRANFRLNIAIPMLFWSLIFVRGSLRGVWIKGALKMPIFGIPSFGIPDFGISVFGIPDFGFPGFGNLCLGEIPSVGCPYLRNPCFRNPWLQNLVAPYCAIPRDYLSDSPYCALWGFWCLNMADWVRYPLPLFWASPPWRACEVEVRERERERYVYNIYIYIYTL